MKTDFANLQYQYQLYKKDIDANIQAVLNKSNYIMGEEVQKLEEELQKFTGVKHAITCSRGTDALLLAMMAIDIEPDDEVITTPFIFIATAETIALMKAKPVFVDIEEDTYNIDATKIEAAITNKTKAIMPVSLYGQPADMDATQSIANKYNLKVIVDGAQSFGSTYKGKTDSNLADISTKYLSKINLTKRHRLFPCSAWEYRPVYAIARYAFPRRAWEREHFPYFLYCNRSPTHYGV